MTDKPEVDGVDETVQDFERFGHEVEDAVLDEINKVAEQIVDEMTEPAPAPIYPIQWDSDTQRKAFFATDGFGGGIPHVRTLQTESAWQAIPMDDGTEIQNPLSHSVFVYGTYENPDLQSDIHVDNQKAYKTVVDYILGKLPENIRQRIEIVSAKYNRN